MQFRHAKTYPTVNSGYGHFPVIIIKKTDEGNHSQHWQKRTPRKDRQKKLDDTELKAGKRREFFIHRKTYIASVHKINKWTDRQNAGV